LILTVTLADYTVVLELKSSLRLRYSDVTL